MFENSSKEFHVVKIHGFFRTYLRLQKGFKMNKVLGEVSKLSD